jgi:hypothetical protein
MARGASNPRDQVIELLKQDHKHVKKHFQEFEKLDTQNDGQSAQALVQRVCSELEVHATLEEELFYPAARAALAGGEAEHLLDEAEVEHNSLKVLIAELQGLTPDDPMLKANFKVLSEYVKHHVKEEEGELFESLGRAKLEWETLLQEMVERQQALKAEKGLDDESEPALEGAMHAESRRRGGASHAKSGR